MIRATNSAQALQSRRAQKSTDNAENWRSNFLGSRSDGELKDEPQAFLIEMKPNQVITPHFHEVDQFQVFVAGGGSLGRNDDDTAPISVQYADHHTAYGPIKSGPHGYSYFTLRAKTDPKTVFLHQPGYREKLKPSKQRHFLVHVTLSSEPVLQSRDSAVLESLLEDREKEADGMGAFLLRAGQHMKTIGPDPCGTGGQYYLVMNGSLEFQSASYPPWSTVFVDPAEAPLEVVAGSKGVEVLVLQYPRA